MSEQPASQWGRIAADGTAYVRTADGERVVGSWHAGTPEEGVAYFALRYEDLAAEVGILHKRLTADAAHAKAVSEAAARITASLPEARVIGDLEGLERRLAIITQLAADRLAEHRASRAAERQASTAAKQTLAQEAERIATSNDWKATGDRLRDIAEEWRAIKGAEKAVETELWRRFAAARDTFTRRRSEYFAALDKQRKASVAHKKELIERAKALSDSDDWAATSTRYRELLTEWKAAGRGSRDADDALWSEFRAAQDAFYSRRAAMHAEKDAGLRRNQEAKEALLAEAEGLDPVADLAGAQRRMRDLLERWTKAGRPPREAEAELERRLEAVQDRIRDAVDDRWQTGRSVDASPLVIRLRESITKLEGRAARAKDRGDAAALAEAEAALTTQRSWLEQAQRS